MLMFDSSISISNFPIVIDVFLKRANVCLRIIKIQIQVCFKVYMYELFEVNSEWVFYVYSRWTILVLSYSKGDFRS